VTAVPQTQRIKIESPHKSDTVARAPSNLLRISGRVESAIERERRILRVVKSRCFGVLTEEDLSLVRVEARRAKERDA
jgi:hypothetical protein